jgi:glycosyltransferase involved in cell wall biosynthesis
MEKNLIRSVSAVIPTRNRKLALSATLQSLANQSRQPDEIIIVDASDNGNTKELVGSYVNILNSTLKYIKAQTKGAASQRNEGVALAHCEYILFLDDDLLFEDYCIERLYQALTNDASLGGVNAMITNQKYHPPGRVSRILYRYLNGAELESYAGKCLGPAVNLLPEDGDHLPEVVPVEWLNTTCTLYRKEVLPIPPFPSFFTGYSLFEDVALSVFVSRKWKLANMRTARIYHDSQPGDHKRSIAELSKMEVLNRYYVTRQILYRNGFSNMTKLIVVEFYKLASYLQSIEGIKKFPLVLWGKILGFIRILKS